MFLKGQYRSAGLDGRVEGNRRTSTVLLIAVAKLSLVHGWKRLDGNPWYRVRVWNRSGNNAG
jgi:hypothetical protein